MIRKYKLRLEDEKSALRHEHAYALYGELMSRIDSGIADSLHTDGFTPIAQHLEFEKGSADWIISTFDDEIAESVENALSGIGEIIIKDAT